MKTSSRTAYLIFLLWFAGLCAAAQFAKIAIPFSHVKTIYPDIGSELGWLLSLISLVGAVLGVVAGSLVAWAGPRRMLLFGLILGAGVSIWQSMLPAFSVMLVSRVIEGVSHLVIVVAAPTLIAQLSSDRYRGAAMALWSTFFGVSFALMAWLGMIIVTDGGLEALFVVHAALMLLSAILLAAGLKSHATRSNSNRLPRTSELIKVHARAYRSASISAPGIGWLFYTLTFVSLLAILPLQFEGDTGSRIAGLMSAVSIVSAMMLVPLFLRRGTSVQIVIIGFGGAILVSLMQLSGVPLMIICLTLFVVLGLVQGASFSAVPELNTTFEPQALSYGMMAQMGNTGNLLGTPLLLTIFSSGGVDAVFVTAAVLYAVAIGAHLVLSGRRNRAANN